MIIPTSRFGDLDYAPKQQIYFPDGLIGFEDLQDFVAMPNRQAVPIFWIQSVDRPDFSLLLTDPSSFFPDYNVAPSSLDRRKLDLTDHGVYHTLSIVSLHEDKSICFNLAAPILLAPTSKRALQTILEGAPYNIKTFFPIT